jgi:asparagine synthase (glutamine-hydrolysing)
MVADVPLGALLSGGIDSSTVVALMQAQASRPVKTFTVGFGDRKYDEADAGAKVAKHLGTDHTELHVSPGDAQSVIPKLPDIYDEPFADSSQIPTFLICQLARKSVTVCLSGDGGDELFGGYTRHVTADRIWQIVRRLPRPLLGLGARIIRGIPPASWDSMYAVGERCIPHRWRVSLPGDKIYKLGDLLGARSSDDVYHRLISQWNAPLELVIDGCEPSQTALFGPRLERMPSFTERMMYLDLVTYLPDDILVKVDRASMAVSLEARCPLLDHRLVEWVWKLPLSLRIRNGQSKWLLKQVLFRFVPQSLVVRPKMGFAVPVDNWLRGPLRDWTESLISEGRLRREGLFNPGPVRQAWRDHLTGVRNEQRRLWVILMLQAWRERWAA